MVSSAWIALLMITGLYLAAMWDVYLGNTNEPTITDALRLWSSRWPILPLSIGFVGGHVFWCSCPKILAVMEKVSPIQTIP